MDQARRLQAYWEYKPFCNDVEKYYKEFGVPIDRNAEADFAITQVYSAWDESSPDKSFQGFGWGDALKCLSCLGEGFVHGLGYWCGNENCKRHYYAGAPSDGDRVSYDNALASTVERLRTLLDFEDHPVVERVRGAVTVAEQFVKTYHMHIARNPERILGEGGLVYYLYHAVGDATDGLPYYEGWVEPRDGACTIVVGLCRLFDGLTGAELDRLEDEHYLFFQDWARHWADHVHHEPQSWPHAMQVCTPCISAEHPSRWGEDTDSENYVGTSEVDFEEHIRYRNRTVAEHQRLLRWLDEKNLSGILDMFYTDLEAEMEEGRYPFYDLG